MNRSQNMANSVAVAAPAPRTLPNLWTWPRSIQIDWAYAAVDKRDLRLDFLRGFAVFAMVVDHFGGSSWLYLITGGNTFFVSAAEAFIFISGLVVGMVYGAMALKQGLRLAQGKALRRAWTLYQVTVVLTLAFAAGSTWLQLPWARTLPIGDPLAFVLNVITLRQTMYLADVPLLYTWLMLLTPLGLWLLVKRRTTAMLGLSTAVWLSFQFLQIEAPWPIVGNTTFNLAAWQLLFFTGMALGFHRDAIAHKLSQITKVPYLIFSVLLFAWLVLLWQTNGAFLRQMLTGAEVRTLMHSLFLKSALAPGRLIASVIVFQFAYLFATCCWRPLCLGLGWLLMPLGQNSLYSYSMHVAVIGLFYSILPFLPENILARGTLNTCLQLLAVLAIWGMVQRRFLFGLVPR